MKSGIKITSNEEGRHVVTDAHGSEVAVFTRHENDWSIGLRLYHGKHSTYIQQRHVTDDAKTRERINRIFDCVGLSEEIERLRSLYAANRALWDEKSSTTDSKRFRELNEGGLLRTSDMAVESQRDIVAAKMYLRIGATTTDLCRLGL